MLNEALCTLGVVKLPTAKAMLATACRDMIDESVQMVFINLLDSNLANRSPMTQMRCTTQQKLCRSSPIASGVEPASETLNMLAGRTFAQLAYFELTIEVTPQHDNLLWL